MRRSPVIRLFAVAAVLALVAAGCAKKSTPSADVSPGGSGKMIEGGTLRIAGGGPDSLNPFVGTAQESYAIFQEIYPFLIEYNATYDDFEPDFATDWEFSEDGTVLTFHTREGATWSDGEPLTAEDVAFTLNTYNTPGSGWGDYTNHMETIEAPDPNTVVITYDKETGNSLPNIQTMMILPRHVWESAANEGVKALKEVPDKAPIVGGGAFTLTKYNPDEFAIFETNPTFYGEKPIIDGWGVQFYEEDEAEIAALQSGEVDLIWFLSPQGVEPLEAGGFKINQSEGVEFHDIIFNSNPKKTEHAEIRDQQLRLALEYATNRQRLIDTTQLGMASPGTSIVPPVTGKWYNSSIQAVPYDLTKANQILDEAGFTDSDGDGVRETSDGTTLSYEVGTQNGQPGVNRVFEILKEDWGKVGVEIRQKPLAYNALWEWNQAPINDKTGIGEYLDFEIIIWSWVPLQDPDFILSVLGCNQLSVWSDTAYCDKAYDQMYDQQGVAVDQKKRKDIVWEMQEKIYNERPYIVMYYTDALYAYSPNWDGLLPSPQGPVNAFNRDTLTQVHQVG